MATLTDSTNLTGTITLSKATGTKVTLDTDKKYLTKDIELTINAPSATITKNGATVSYTNGWVNAGSTTVTDSNLVPANIVSGVTIFGVTGTYTGVVIDETPDANGGTITTITTGVDTLKTQGKVGITPMTTSQTIRPDNGYDALSSVQINPIPSQYIVPSGTKTITQNGNNIDVAAYATVNVSVTSSSSEVSLQEKTGITPTESSQTITPDSGYDALSSVQINAISSTYVGSGITRRSSTDLTASGATVTVPAGYYAEQASKSVTTMTLPTSAALSATSGYTSKATIGRSTSAQYINIPPGYNSAGGYYTISATPNGTVTAPSSISGTSASITTGTNTITLTKTVSVTPNVSTAGYISSGTAGNSSVSLTASVTVNPTPTASGAIVTIPAGYYSAQTTKSVSSGSATGPSTVSGTSASISTGTNTITLTKTNVTTTPTVSAGYVSAATASTATVTLTASVTTKAAATITPGTTNQTIASGTYLTGTQTIAGDADLVASNIISTANIFGVQGSVVINKYYTGSAAPSSSLGNNGDIYFQE